MFKIGHIVFIFSFLFLASFVGFANADFTPLLDAKSSEIINLDVKLNSAKSAINAGLYPLAESISKKIIDINKDNKEAKYILIDALLGQAKFDLARKYLAHFDGDTNEDIYLKRAIVSVALGNYARADFFLDKINPKNLTGDDASWYNLIRAFAQKAKKDFISSQDYFDLVSKDSDNRILKNLATIYNYQSMMERSMQNPESAKESIRKLLPDLEKSYQDYNATEVGFLFAKDYALALHSLDETNKAIEILNAQLDSPIISESSFEELSITLALISRGLSTQRTVINSILTKTNSVEVAETALYLLMEANNDKSLSITNLEDIINKTNCNLKDRLLLECAYISLSLNKYDNAIYYANMLIEQYPASRYLVNAKGILAHNAFSPLEGNSEYRLASKHLDEMAKLEPSREKAQIMKLLSADCYYLDKDYNLSAIAYKELFDSPLLSAYRGVILNRYLDSLLGIDDIKEASLLLDKAFLSDIDRNQIWAAQWNVISYLRKKGELKPALNLASRALNILEKNREVNDVLLLRIMWLKAKLCIENQEFEECISLCNRILKESRSLKERDTEFQILINSDSMLLKARALSAIKELDGEDGAYKTFEMLRQIYPKTESAIASFLIEASVSGNSGDLIKASNFCEQLYEAYPNSSYAAIALFEASQYLRSTGQSNSYKQALKLLAELIKNYPESDLIFYAKISQCEMLRLLNAFSEARNIYQDIINNYPTHKDINTAHIGLGDTLLAREGNEGKAAMQYERAYNLANADLGSRAEAGFKLGFALEKSGRKQEAQEIWFISSNTLIEDKEALEASSKARYWLGRSLLYLARSFEINNDKSSAIRTYNMIISNNLPGENEAKQRLNK